MTSNTQKVSSSDPQSDLVEALKGMLARPDYLLPLAAAERQFRDHYYGLNSAALLEDLFYDALGSYVRQTSPAAQLTRPPSGQKGWDYAFEGLQVSHKVSQSVGEIGALWDATKVGETEWSFDEPIVYVLGAHAPPTKVSVSIDSQAPIGARATASLAKPYVADGRTILVVQWPTGGRPAKLLDVIGTSPGELVAKALPFSHMWEYVANHVSTGGAANEIDVLVTNVRSKDMPGQPKVSPNSDIAIEVMYRGGVYFMRRETLQNLPIRTNNRGILIPTPTVKDLLAKAANHGLLVPMPTWYWIYAEERPPDMYSTQRAEYDSRFSARGNLDA